MKLQSFLTAPSQRLAKYGFDYTGEIMIFTASVTDGYEISNITIAFNDHPDVELRTRLKVLYTVLNEGADH